MRTNGKGSDLFQYADLVQGISGIFCLIFAAFTSIRRSEAPNPIPVKEMIILGVLYALNVNALNYCLYYIPYPMRVVGDKMGYLTAVLVGVFFSRIGKSDGLRLGKEKIVIAIMITIGTMIFSFFYHPNKQNETRYKTDEMWIGFVLLAVSVTCEALFSDSQAYLKVYFKPTMNHLIYSVNLIGVIYSFSVLIFRGQLSQSVKFCFKHTEILRDITIFSTLTVLGQISIYYVVLNFKQHMFPLISTTRKVFTVLLSIYIYEHPMNVYLWIGLVLVFGGLIYELVDELYYDISG